MKTLNQFNVTDNSNVDDVAQSAKGSQDNPFTVAEYEALSESQEWQGGYVEEVGMVESEIIEAPVFSYGSQGDASEYYSPIDPNKDENYTVKYAGSNAAQLLGNDCVFRCIGALLGVDSLIIADMYGDYLKENNIVTEKDKISGYIANGVNSGNYESFFQYVSNKKPININMEDGEDLRDEMAQGNLTQIESLVPITITYKGKNENHMIIVNSQKVNGEWKSTYYDPQNKMPADMQFRIESIPTFYVTKKL